jgi:hypothetical protein
VRGFDENFIVSERFGGVIGDNVARDATKNVKGDAIGRHIVGCILMVRFDTNVWATSKLLF